MEFNIELMDKSHFVCFQLKDESVYFGEVQYQSEDGKLFDPKENPEAKEQGKPVRHGFGIQLYGTNPDNFLCKYEGFWTQDKQNGQCKMWFPDKATFEGTVKSGVKEGFGKFSWPNGDVYEGNWRNNRFEGGGTFNHHDGSVRKGQFKNNYYVQHEEIFINPFLSNEETEEFLQRRNEIVQIKEKNKKEKLFFFEKTGNLEKLSNLMKQSNKNSRIPLVLTSKENNSSMQKVFSLLQNVNGKKFHDFDLRKIQYKKDTDKTHNDYLNGIKNHLSDVLVKGQTFIINVDESDVPFEEIFYPDIREYYKPSSFPQQIWDIDELRKYQVFEKIISNTENQFALDVKDDFRITVWSKYKLSEELENKAIIEKLERRFSSILPMIKLDFILLTSVDEVELYEKQVREQQELERKQREAEELAQQQEKGKKK